MSHVSYSIQTRTQPATIIMEIGNSTDPATRRGRVDDIDLKLAEQDTVLCGSNFNEYETAVNGNLQFNPNSSLRTIDWHRFGTILPVPDSSSNGPPCNFSVLYQNGQSFVATVDDLLSDTEIDQILAQSWQPQHYHYNRSDRAIVIDEAFSHLLWNRLEGTIAQIEERVEQLQPLGFGTSGVHWKLQKLNPAIRINSYRPGQSFAIHRDAQFSESRTSRSVFGLLVYLSDAFPIGGETRFSIPQNSNGILLPNSPLSVAEELKFYAENGIVMEEVSVTPARGRCVIFSHDLLHESLPLLQVNGGALDDDEAQKVVLRTDIVATCSGNPMFMTRDEVQDYQRSLDLFTRAEEIELEYSRYCWTQALFDHASSDSEDEYLYPVNKPERFSEKSSQEFYEKSLYLRYRYPKALKNHSIPDHTLLEKTLRDLGEGPLVKVMSFLTLAEKSQLTVLCPSLTKEFRASENLVDRDAQAFSAANPIEMGEPGPSDTNHRRSIQLTVRSTEDFHEHYEAWCRVATVLVLYKMTHAFAAPSKRPWYCARFMPQTGQVLAVPLERLIYDAFMNQKGCGAIFAVEKQTGDEDFRRDFEASVDRSIMLRDFGVEFTGQNVFEHVSVEIGRAPTTDNLTRDVNVTTPFLAIRGYVGDHFDGKKGLDWLPPKGRTGPGRRCVFSSCTRQGRFNLEDHCNIDLFGATLSAEGLESREDHVFNQCIFDFERHELKITTSTDDDGNVVYSVDFEPIARNVAPFYHAAAYHGHVDLGISTKMLFTPIRSAYYNNEKTIRVKANEIGESEWVVNVDWDLNFFEIVL